MRSVKEEREEEEQDTDERDEGVVEEIQDETVAYYQWWPNNRLGVKKTVIGKPEKIMFPGSRKFSLKYYRQCNIDVVFFGGGGGAAILD